MWDAILKVLSLAWDNLRLAIASISIIGLILIIFQLLNHLENKKKSKKGQIIEILNDVIQPSINHLEYEIPKLEKREYLPYDRDTNQYTPCASKIFHEEPKFKSLQSNEPFLNRVIPRKSITRKMKNHDGISNDLNEKLKSIENSLENKIDFEAVKRMVMAHNTENPGQEINLLSDDYKKRGMYPWPSATKERMLEHIIVGIINGKYEFSLQKGSKFWDKYGPAFLKMRNDDYVSKQFRELGQLSNKMLISCKNLKKELEELRESLKDDYNIPHGAVPIYRLPK